MKHLIVSFLIVFACCWAHGQDSVFNKRFHLGLDNVIFRSIEISNDTFVITGVGVNPYYVSVFSKFDFSGEPINYQFTGSSEEIIAVFGRDLVQYEPGAWMVSGEGADSTGGYSLVMKFNAQGALLQKEKIYSPFYPQEQFIVAYGGMIQIPGGWMVQTNIYNWLSQPKSNDLYIVKLNEELEMLWGKKIENPQRDEGGVSIKYRNGKALIGAFRNNYNTNGKSFIHQLYLLEIDTLNGDITKTFLYPYTPTNQLLMGPADDMLVEDDGSVIVATRIGKEEPINPVSSYIRWTSSILKVNANLSQVLWEQTMFSGSTNDATQFYKVVEAPDQSGYVAAGAATYEPGIFGGALAKVSPAGDSLWLRHYKYVTTPLATHYIYDLEPTPDGGYVMVGEARPYNGLDTLFPPPIQQGWILKVDEWGCLVPGCQMDVGAEEAPGEEEPVLKVYPNPASEALYIHLPNAGPQGRFRLVDILGRTVREFAASPGDTTYILLLDGLPAGWYALVYEEGGRRLSLSVYRL